MRQSEIEHFLKIRHSYLERIEAFKLSSIGKAIKNKIINFNHSFYGNYKIKFIRLTMNILNFTF
jgi:hypothetical protein